MGEAEGERIPTTKGGGWEGREEATLNMCNHVVSLLAEIILSRN